MKINRKDINAMDISNIKGMLSVPTERLKTALDTIEVAKKMLIEVSEHYHYRYSEDYMKEIADKLDDASAIISMINNGYMVQEIQDSDADIVNNCTTRCQEATDTFDGDGIKIGNNNGYVEITAIQNAVANLSKEKGFTVDKFDDIFDKAIIGVCTARSQMPPSKMFSIVKENIIKNNIYAALYVYYNDGIDGECRNALYKTRIGNGAELYNIKDSKDSIVRYIANLHTHTFDIDNIYDSSKPSVIMKFKYDVNLEYQNGITPASVVTKSAYLVVFIRGVSQTCPLSVIGIKKINDCLGLVSTNPDKELIIEYAIY